jgi:hypothetical protein
MPIETRELYGSPNGDRWLLGRDAGRVFVRHEANAASGGQVTDIDIGDFLGRGARNPEHEALLCLIGTLARAAADQLVAAHEISAIDFVEHAVRSRAAHYREEGDRFRTMAEVEPLAALRRHLEVLARQYEQIATDLETKGQGLVANRGAV